ncbi:sigma-54-dependent transcriptional regulator [Haliangium ochraceum]|uniref:Two component, sigma54 specific, transcriptional regulator, Fis family n=1 Tax=Haliangium ochraceum (strain DSM 14365 / JCM 11303 / SMP-2) TaxID=502025 RepID=D0LIH3_HALO1|nr:sigma-54 dependent transcriptional regulator [Haliangium ochraceum]ACY18329.1 two component, sigma54 specific, transcriptional regulator, Fis family [Haliangium ochraceum DSM 14365]
MSSNETAAPAAPPARILVVDDERGIRALCSDVLRRAGHEVEVADTGTAGLAAAKAKRFDLIFCDINLPGVDGLTMLPSLLEREDPPTVILITAFPSVETAVRGMKLGARDYLTKPFTPDELRMVCRRALSEDAMRRENAELRHALAYGNLVGQSPAMLQLKKTVAKVAGADINVLVMGESGTGKELVARALHYQGARAGRAFVPVNCGALVDSLLESELFGHVRGAFTGAEQAKRGLFLAADGGTLFLDEIGELPLALQPKLLRALQDGEIKPVGGLEPQRVDVRVVAATNRDLQEAVAQGSFREDLFYRLNVITIEVPALRERREDVPVLAQHFAASAARRARRACPDISPAALEWLAAQPWPGNVRQLENAIERAVVLAAGNTLGIEDFQPRAGVAGLAAESAPGRRTGGRGDSADDLLSLDELERLHILRVLEACGGQKTKASAVLGINRTTLWKKLRQYGLE